MKSFFSVLGLLLLASGIFAQELPPPPPPPPINLDFDTVQYKPLIRMIPSEINTQLTRKHSRIEGTRVFIVEPKGFEPAPGQSYVHKKDADLTFMLSDKKADFDQAAENLKKRIARIDHAIVLQKEIRMNGNRTILYEVIEPSLAASVLFLITGNDSISTMGMFNCKLKDRDMMGLYQKTIESFFYDHHYPQPIATVALNSSSKNKSLYDQLSFPIENKLTANHERLRGTRLFTLPFPEFEIKSMRLVYTQNPNLWIMVGNRPMSLTKATDSLTKIFAESNPSKMIRTEVRVNELQGSYIEAIDTLSGSSVAVLLTGTDSFSLMQMFVCDLDNDDLMKEYTRFIQTSFYKQDYPIDLSENLSYRIDPGLAGFKIAHYNMGVTAFSEDGTQNDDHPFETHFKITELEAMTAERARLAMDKGLALITDYMNITATMIETSSVFVNDHLVLIREFDLVQNQTQEKGYCYLAFILGPDSTLCFEAFTNKDAEGYKKKWKQVIESISFRK